MKGIVSSLILILNLLVPAAKAADTNTQSSEHSGTSSLEAVSFAEYRSWDLDRKAEILAELEKDPNYQRLSATRLPEGSKAIPESGIFDEGLRYLPISPLDIHEIRRQEEMEDGFVSGLTGKLHRRWLQLHFPDTFSGSGENTSPKPIPENKKAQEVSSNHNVGAFEPVPPDEYQGEVQIAVNPLDPTQIVAASNSWGKLEGGSLDCGEGPILVFYSMDEGENWHNTCAPRAEDYGLEEPLRGCDMTTGSDPEVIWDDQGRAYLQYMAVCYQCNTLTCYPAGASMVVARSVNGGASWAAHGIIRDGWKQDGLLKMNDKNFMEIDTHPISSESGEANPHYGNQYVCWDRDHDEVIAYSTDGGVQWTEADLPGLVGLPEIGCELAVSDTGTVHIVYQGIDPDYQFQRTYYSQSSDGGRTWTQPQMLAEEHFVSFSTGSNIEAQDERGASNFAFIDVDNSGGACHGALYTVYTDAPSVDEQEAADIFVIRSIDGGTSWSAPVRVNDDDSPFAQFHPALSVDQSTGDVLVVWQDTRNSEQGRKIDIYLARSTDCGLSFEANIRVSAPSPEFPNDDVSFSNLNTADNPNANPNQTGDYIGLDAFGGKAYVSWTDSREYMPRPLGSQEENIGMAVVSFAAPEDPNIFSDGFEGGNLDSWSNQNP